MSCVDPVGRLTTTPLPRPGDPLVAVLASYHAVPIALARDEKRSPFVGLQEGISPEWGPMSLACGRLPRKSVPGLASSGRSPCHFGWLVRNARRNGRVPRSGRGIWGGAATKLGSPSKAGRHVAGKLYQGPWAS
jgi:hypothetical protein